MRGRIIDEEIQLIKYYPNYKTALEWYQDLEVCKQVDNRDTVYDLPLLKRMYNYLNQHGDLFYIKYKNRLCGDVCLQPDGEVNIVVAKPFQNRHIGRRVMSGIIQLAKEKGMQEFIRLTSNQGRCLKAWDSSRWMRKSTGWCCRGFSQKEV